MSADDRGTAGTIGLALLSLLLGVFVWMTVRQQQMERIQLNVPVLLLADRKDAAFYDYRIEPKEVPVEFLVPRTAKEKPKGSDYRILLFKDPADLERRPKIEEMNVSDTQRLRLEDVEAVSSDRSEAVATAMQVNEVKWTARLRTKMLPVVVSHDGEPAKGFRISGDWEVEPKEVSVAYPQDLEGKLEPQLKTAQVNVKDKTANVVETVAVELPAGVRAVPAREKLMVRVIVPISEEIMERTIEGVKVDYQPLKSGLRARVEPDRIAVDVRGPRSTVEALKAENLRVNLVGPEEQEGESTAALRTLIDLPAEKRDSVEVTSESVRMIRVTISAERSGGS